MADNNEALFDMDDMPKTKMEGAPRINKAGIHHNLKVACELKSGKYKNQETNPGEWLAFSVTLTDPDGFEFTELYFQPPTTVEQLGERKYPMKKYAIVEKKTTEIGITTSQEEIKHLNNEFLAYLIDLGEALGYQYNDIRDHLFKNLKSFKILSEAFLSKFRPSDNARVSAKLLYYNNKNKQTSQLQIHGAFPKYYPYSNDFFDVYIKDRPTVLRLNDYEIKTGTIKEYTGEGDQPKNKDTVTKKVNTKTTAGTTVDPDEDPF